MQFMPSCIMLRPRKQTSPTQLAARASETLHSSDLPSLPLTQQGSIATSHQSCCRHIREADYPTAGLGIHHRGCPSPDSCQKMAEGGAVLFEHELQTVDKFKPKTGATAKAKPSPILGHSCFLLMSSGSTSRCESQPSWHAERH